MEVEEQNENTIQTEIPNETQEEINIPDSESTSESTVQTENESVEQQEETPTLNEYLSLLTCGGCGRNCLLTNPHCHNGSRKASMATEEYYSIYG